MHIHLKELGVNEEWVWKPDGKPEKLDKQLGEATGRSATGFNWIAVAKTKTHLAKAGQKLCRDKRSVKVGD